MLPPGIGNTYWYDRERGSLYMGDFDRVAEEDGWAWMRVTGPWMQYPRGQFASDSRFTAGFTGYDSARDSLQGGLAGYPEGAATLRASKLETGLVLCFPIDGPDLAFALFAVRRGVAPDREGPQRFTAWRSRLPANERSTLMKSGKPKIWPL